MEFLCGNSCCLIIESDHKLHRCGRIPILKYPAHDEPLEHPTGYHFRCKLHSPKK